MHCEACQESFNKSVLTELDANGGPLPVDGVCAAVTVASDINVIYVT